MDYYLDLHLLPDPEFSPPVLLNALFAKLHRALVRQKRNDVGISFPGYESSLPARAGKRAGATLGKILRLHGGEVALNSLMADDWLTGMRDHISLSEIRRVPANVGYIQVQRRQAKSNPGRERKRLMRRQGLSEADALQRIPDSSAEHLDLPFVTLTSQSTGRRQFRLFIAQYAATDALAGEFNSYGLSHQATLPQF